MNHGIIAAIAVGLSAATIGVLAMRRKWQDELAIKAGFEPVKDFDPKAVKEAVMEAAQQPKEAEVKAEAEVVSPAEEPEIVSQGECSAAVEEVAQTESQPEVMEQLGPQGEEGLRGDAHYVVSEEEAVRVFTRAPEHGFGRRHPVDEIREYTAARVADSPVHRLFESMRQDLKNDGREIPFDRRWLTAQRELGNLDLIDTKRHNKGYYSSEDDENRAILHITRRGVTGAMETEEGITWGTSRKETVLSQRMHLDECELDDFLSGRYLSRKDKSTGHL